MTDLRKTLPPLPPRMYALPRDHRGFPVPWFVQFMPDGKPDFRILNTQHLYRAVNEKRCWICGDYLGVHLAFVLGPMCAINQINAEPPSHLDCALFAVKACPFLIEPRMRRNTKNMPEHLPAPGIHLDRNPGATCVWVTRSYKPFKADDGILFSIGKPEQIYWFAEGRPALRCEVETSIEGGLPSLKKLAEQEGPKAMRELDERLKRLHRLLPMEKVNHT